MAEINNEEMQMQQGRVEYVRRLTNEQLVELYGTMGPEIDSLINKEAAGRSIEPVRTRDLEDMGSSI